MNNPLIRTLGILALLSATVTQAGTLYVDLNSVNPTSPYSDWSTAATNIQDAIDASVAGDQIWVTNGVYQTGGKVMAGNLTNRVALDKAVTVQSVNGPFVTTIVGIGATNGAIGVRCAWLTNSAALVGFTLMRGATRNSGDPNSLGSGGGVWCASSNALVDTCIIVSNTAFSKGCGAFQGSLRDCFISGNTTALAGYSGGAAYFAVLNSCTVVSNVCYGLTGCQATNSISYYNFAGNFFSGNTMSYCCTTPAVAGTGNIVGAPLFFLDRIHLSLGSPGIGAGTTPVTSTDIFGKTWSSPPSMGCAETAGLPYVSPPQVQLTKNPIGFTTTALSLGSEPLTYTWLRNGVPLEDDGHFTGTQSTNLIAAGITFADSGYYQLVASNNAGAVTSAIGRVVIHCVDAAGTTPVAPYTTWDTAAMNIQDAIDAAVAGEIVLVTNGVYSAGGKAEGNDLTNRVALDKAIVMSSANGYKSTVIEGHWDPATNGPTAVRCAWLADGAVLSGFTLRNGATWGGGLSNSDIQRGGGAWLSGSALIANCVITNNSANYAGGGVAFGTVNNSFLGYNSAYQGGGAYSSRLNNCTVRQNYFLLSFGSAGGVASCVCRNCIIYDNYDSVFQYNVSNYSTSFLTDNFTNCCVTPLPSRGVGNISNSPLFSGLNFHLLPNSPCRGAGNALFASGIDLDNEPFANPPAMGCDEVIDTNLNGTISVSLLYPDIRTLVDHRVFFRGSVEGHVSELDWSFGDGTTVTNIGSSASHYFATPGTYTVTLTAYNLDNPAGVSSSSIAIIDPYLSPVIQSPGVVSNNFQFTFLAQGYGFYRVQYTTNLAPPISWQYLPAFYFSSTNTIMTVQDPATNWTRFYRIFGQ
jgi:hypothetical protein